MEGRISVPDLKRSTKKSFSRSSGPGGQNVNKTSSKVTLFFDIENSFLKNEEIERLLKKFPKGMIQVVNQESRSQWMNTELAFDHLKELIERSIQVPKKRKKTLAPYQRPGGKKKKVKKAHLIKYRRRYLE